MRIRIMLTILSVLFANTAIARTWTVEKDGSGNFTIIQDALDAAEAGDTVLIGPGRYDTFRYGTWGPDSKPKSVIAWIRTPDLTVIGAGMDATIIGPSVPTAEAEGAVASGLFVDIGGSAVIRDLQIEQTLYDVGFLGPTIMENCRVNHVFDNSPAIEVGLTQDVELRGIEVNARLGILLTLSQNVVVEDCRFEDSSASGIAIAVTHSSTGCIVRQSTFTGGDTGLLCTSGSSVEINDCEFRSIVRSSVFMSGGLMTIVRRCNIGMSSEPLRVAGGTLEVYDSVVEGGTSATITAWGQVLVRNSHLLNAGGLTVIVPAGPAGQVIDLRHNWWGTTDTAQIDAWISDPSGAVLWQPIADLPIPTESSSMSSLKGQFLNE